MSSGTKIVIKGPINLSFAWERTERETNKDGSVKMNFMVIMVFRATTLLTWQSKTHLQN